MLAVSTEAEAKAFVTELAETRFEERKPDLETVQDLTPRIADLPDAVIGQKIGRYELLTGKTPFDARALISQGLDAIRKTIREQEPPRPSTKLATLPGQELTTTAQRRSVETAKLVHQLKGDLDWIVMKCPEKDRTRRYETANGLAVDIKRHLTSEPVLARPPSKLYEWQRLVRRHKFGFAAAGAIVVALSAGVVVSAWQAVRARQERDAKELARQDAEAVSKFLSEVFQSPDPGRDGRTITVAETLDKAAKKLEGDLATQPARRARLQDTLGSTYFGLGLYPEAIALQEKVRAYDLATLGSEHPDTVRAMNNLAIFYDLTGRWDEALQLQEQVLPLCRKVNGPEHGETLRAMGNLALSYARSGRRDEALKLQEEVLRVSRKVNGPEHPDTLMAMGNVASSYGDMGRGDQASKLGEEALALSRKVLGPEHPDTMEAMITLADHYRTADRSNEAVTLGRSALELSRKTVGETNASTFNAMTELAITCRTAGRTAEAIALERESLRLKRQYLPAGDSRLLDSLENLATCYEQSEQKADAELLRRELAQLKVKGAKPEAGPVKSVGR